MAANGVVKTHCNRGHEFTTANTYQTVSPEGYRVRHCRACQKERYHERKKREGMATCKEYVRGHWGVDAPLVPCDRPVSGQTGQCEAHYARARRGKCEMDRPFNTPRRNSEEVKSRDLLGQKRCNKCRQFLPESQFIPREDASDGFQHRCQLCTNLFRYGLDRNTIEALLESQNRQCANPGCQTAIEIWTERGVGRKRPRRSDGVSLTCVDHDHRCCSGATSCGKCVRGLLCWHCNAAAGLLSDQSERIFGLAEYMSRRRVSEIRTA
jgi:hypothetical protein